MKHTKIKYILSEDYDAYIDVLYAATATKEEGIKFDFFIGEIKILDVYGDEDDSFYYQNLDEIDQRYWRARVEAYLHQQATEQMPNLPWALRYQAI